MARRTSERIAQRTRTQKFFDTDTPGTSVAVIGAGPIHYEMPGGGWDDLANLVKDVPGGWAAETSETRVGVENGYLTFSKSGRSLQMRPVALGMVDATAPATRWRKLADADYSNITRDGDTVTAHDIFPNTDATLTISEGVVTKAFTVRQKPNPPDPVSLGWNPATTYVVIVWDVQKPTGAVLRDTVTLEVVGSGYARKNPLVVETAQGDPVVYFDAGEAVSANGRTGPVWYVCLGAQVPFAEAIPYSRIMATSYPFVIDPTTRISAAGAGQSGSVNIDLGTPTVMATTTAYAGNNYYYDDGKGVTEYGGPMRGFQRWDLSGLSGTCVSAIIRGHIGHSQTSDNQYLVDRVADWYPLSTDDYSMTPEASAWAGFKAGSGALWADTRSLANKPGTSTWAIASYLNLNWCLDVSTDDGATWTRKYLGSTTAFFSLGWANGKLFSAGIGDVYMSSDDGETWQSGTVAYATSARPPVWTGSAYIMGVLCTSGTGIASSANGTSWTPYGASVIGMTSGGVSVTWDGTYLWAAGSGTNDLRINRTTDATGASGWVAFNYTTGLWYRPLEAAGSQKDLLYAGGSLYLFSQYEAWDEYDTQWVEQINALALFRLVGTEWEYQASFNAAHSTTYSDGLTTDGTYMYVQAGPRIYRGVLGSSTFTLITSANVDMNNTRSIGAGGSGHLMFATTGTQSTYVAYADVADAGSSVLYRTAYPAVILPAADVQAKFGTVLAARYRAVDESSSAEDLAAYNTTVLEIEYTESGSQNYDRTAGDSISSLTAAVARAGTFARRESRPGD